MSRHCVLRNCQFLTRNLLLSNRSARNVELTKLTFGFRLISTTTSAGPSQTSSTVKEEANRHRTIQLNQPKTRKDGMRNSISDKKFQPASLCLLLIPALCFYLGCWQVQRLKWKRQLIHELKEKGETNIQLRDQHLTYLITWYSLSFITLAMWIAKFFR